MSKFKDIFKIGSAVAKPLIPGGFGAILDIVNDSVENDEDPQNLEALKAMADAIIALDKRLDALENKH